MNEKKINEQEKLSPFNASHCLDLTAYNALKKIEAEEATRQKKLKDIIHIIYKLCDICDFSVEERIVLRDKQTGKVWR